MIISKQKSTVVLSGLVLAIGMTLSGLTQAVIPEKLCVQSMNPPRFASMDELKEELSKTLSAMILDITLMGYPYKHPEDFEVSARRESIRLRADLFQVYKGKTIPKGDLYLDNYTEIGNQGTCDHVALLRGKCEKSKQFFCLNTSDLVQAFEERGESDEGYYLTQVHVEVKGSQSCKLPYDRRTHSSMTAPRKGTLKFKIYGDKPCRQI